MGYDNAAVVRRYMDEVWSQGNLNAVDELCAPDHVAHDPLVGDVRGIDAIKAQVKMYRDGFPDLQFVVLDVIASGEKVATRWRATGTHRGTFMGQLPTGREQTVEGVSYGRVHNGRLVEQWPAWDTLRVAQSLGMLAPTESPARRAEQAQAH